ncbi:hypothetical protein BC937DRAFT_88220 [Endogone sp. FLAS-F59071]|nr:hypothetical protein BC937DRAFT_88220 [Endogone sp. FLAS-F59071]|eukprot:RUS18877.1 hypothetical protein BC937DRAFT_88220 [Endogone sp. FLAS-F59071]
MLPFITKPSTLLSRLFLTSVHSRPSATVLSAAIVTRTRALHASARTEQEPFQMTPLTMEKHPEIKRDPKFNQITLSDLIHFTSILPASSIIYSSSPPTTPSSDLMPYNLDWFSLYRGLSQLVLFPRTTPEVSKILQHCHARQLAVVPQGGNTGVSGGAVPVFDEVIINTSKMTRVRMFDKVSGAVVVDAGIVLERLDEYLAEKEFAMPLDLGAKGSCQIGGNVSTNAGGLRLMRFGSLHGSVLGFYRTALSSTICLRYEKITLVGVHRIGLTDQFATGQVILFLISTSSILSLLNQPAGYDLKQLFIGAEGTLGIVTGVSILTPRRSKAVNVAMIALNSFDDVQRAFMISREELSEILSAFEFWDTESFDVVRTKMLPNVRFPIESAVPYPFYALLETQGSRKEHDDEKLSKYLENLTHAGIVQDGVIAQDAKQVGAPPTPTSCPPHARYGTMRSLWSWRELIPEALTRVGPAITYDLSVEVPLLYRLCEDAKEFLLERRMMSEQGGGVLKVLGFGHVGDGNVHLMAATKTYDHEIQKLLDDYVFEWTAKHHGSISAEHGIGIMKARYLHLSKSPAMIAMMRQLKGAIDPRGIMNPYKVLQ